MQLLIKLKFKKSEVDVRIITFLYFIYKIYQNVSASVVF